MQNAPIFQRTDRMVKSNSRKSTNEVVVRNEIDHPKSTQRPLQRNENESCRNERRTQNRRTPRNRNNAQNVMVNARMNGPNEVKTLCRIDQQVRNEMNAGETSTENRSMVQNEQRSRTGTVVNRIPEHPENERGVGTKNLIEHETGVQHVANNEQKRKCNSKCENGERNVTRGETSPERKRRDRERKTQEHRTNERRNSGRTTRGN